MIFAPHNLHEVVSPIQRGMPMAGMESGSGTLLNPINENQVLLLGAESQEPIYQPNNGNMWIAHTPAYNLGDANSQMQHLSAARYISEFNADSQPTWNTDNGTSQLWGNHTNNTTYMP
uniref:Uncharacterized protein n=1 Tax=Ditylenchus dipsaci TaxID=166011 RepID=A0A915EB64_9BILA